MGPQWALVPGGFTTAFVYDNNVPAGSLWYHDHALGITRLNVYAGLAGFYIVRDASDTGTQGNPLGLPAFPYELAYAIQDRMFWANGELFYPAFPGDPFYDDFITGEDAVLPEDRFPGGGPTVLAEFFGDHIVVNGKIWPKEDVKPRNYRLRLLNGTDSRFMALQFVAVNAGDTDFTNAGAPIPFYVIGSDQGLASSATQTDLLLFEPGARYDIVFDFKGLQGKRIIMKNIGGDEPFGGDIPGPQVFEFTDRIMAFDVADTPDLPDRFDPSVIGHYGGNTAPVDRVRKVALFEGEDEFGRLQPLLGTAEPATDYMGEPILWPDEPAYRDVGLVGQMEGTIGWHSPTTENPALGSTEVWEIYNTTMDAHPIHLHLVNFQILDRQAFTATLVPQPVVQHDGAIGEGARLMDIALGDQVPAPPGYIENAPKDVVIALPGQVTRIKATFDKPGRYVWHCHILSHEDHEMMRVLHVGPIPGRHTDAVNVTPSDLASLPPEDSERRVFIPHLTKQGPPPGALRPPQGGSVPRHAPSLSPVPAQRPSPRTPRPLQLPCTQRLSPRAVTRNSQRTTRNPQPATHNPQPATLNAQLAPEPAPSPLTRHTCTVIMALTVDCALIPFAPHPAAPNVAIRNTSSPSVPCNLSPATHNSEPTTPPSVTCNLSPETRNPPPGTRNPHPSTHNS